MSINQARGLLYWIAKILGDVQAGKKAMDQGSLDPIVKRAGRRIVGREMGRLLGRLFR